MISSFLVIGLAACVEGKCQVYIQLQGGISCLKESL